MSDNTKSSENKVFRAGMVVIGNEILSGRTQDKNINWLASRLSEQGIALAEVRIVPDIEAKIIEAVVTLKEEYDYVFTSGGIGPTHDDITADSVAKALGAELVMNDEARVILLEHYGEENLTQARLKMARIPVGGALIPNPVSAAPGFQLENVYVMAGVPRIMQAMLDHVLPTLEGGQIMQSRTITCKLPESKLAEALGVIQDEFPSVDIGSYPNFREGNFGVSVVLRSVDEEALGAAAAKVTGMMDDMGAEYVMTLGQ